MPAPWESGKSRSADGVGRLVLAPRQIQSVVWRLLVSPLDGIQSRKSLRSKFFCKFRGGAGNRRHKNVDGLPSPCFLVRVYFESLDNTQSIPADGGAITSLVDVYRPLDPDFSSLNFLRWCVLDGPKVLPQARRVLSDMRRLCWFVEGHPVLWRYAWVCRRESPAQHALGREARRGISSAFRSEFCKGLGRAWS